MPFNLGGPELIIILVIVLIVFGAGKLPSVMRDLGRGVKEFKKAQSEEEAAMTTSTTVATPPPASTAPSANGAGAAAPARAPETSQRA
jgi:sec-independent protein translocase protein TatA